MVLTLLRLSYRINAISRKFTFYIAMVLGQPISTLRCVWLTGIQIPDLWLYPHGVQREITGSCYERRFLCFGRSVFP